MIINITKPDFKTIVKCDDLNLPIRWDGADFYNSLNVLFVKYQSILKDYININDLKKIRSICSELLKCIELYHSGFPNKAFNQINIVMKKLFNNPLSVYKKTGWIDAFKQSDPLMLYRIRNVQNNITYNRKDIFHTPYNLRSKISTCRYSISGYPCLYLGTSLDLCCEETKISSLSDLTITSRFKLERDLSNNGVEINVLELAIKPKDFISDVEDLLSIEKNKIIGRSRHFHSLDLDDIDIMSKFLYWYPLIAACSFIRVNKEESFASEYIIPQLLMQWIRSKSNSDKLIGIRYFSCASERASELGFNYVFPVSGENDSFNNHYCKILSRSFALTKPIYIHEFNTIHHCEDQLRNSNDFEHI